MLVYARMNLFMRKPHLGPLVDGGNLGLRDIFFMNLPQLFPGGGFKCVCVCVCVECVCVCARARVCVCILLPTDQPTNRPTDILTTTPSLLPRIGIIYSKQQTDRLTFCQPTEQPTDKATYCLNNQPIDQPINQANNTPTHPLTHPASMQTANQPTSQPTNQQTT